MVGGQNGDLEKKDVIGCRSKPGGEAYSLSNYMGSKQVV
jgi:hypothetical protein